MQKYSCFLAFLMLLQITFFAQPKTEFRGVWIASVDNVDWPRKGITDADSQRTDFIRILDMHKQNGINAVIVQIRPSTDALYPSQYEPWSQWLTGQQGVPPKPYYDPLEFMINEAHKRGMVFHAWCNPYRAEFKIGDVPLAPTHVIKLHPQWFVKYGDKRYFDPGNKEAQQHVIKVIGDVVSRYNIDAIHFDDYFYPYPIDGKEFPDNATYQKFGKGMKKAAWRRSNVDSIIVMLSRVIKQEKKDCIFGISPFAVWRNKEIDPEGSNTKGGLSNYDDLYADILLWLKKGWIDYVAPQLYLEIGHKKIAYEIMVDWWAEHSYGKHCYIGLGIYRAGSNAAWRNSKELPCQIQLLRMQSNIQGMIFFSSTNFETNPNGWSDSLRLNYFKEPALVPAIK